MSRGEQALGECTTCESCKCDQVKAGSDSLQYVIQLLVLLFVRCIGTLADDNHHHLKSGDGDAPFTVQLQHRTAMI